ncbi:hypothetical protein [Streptomyces spectabilis]|uniref:Uncharacterized protein n=1 Tax=Streptomyces spectabilis TaxID=68270 RepID=A0A7W8B3K6_STRST|nr:hypothetical protein [Streptomyces spectabilis]MBB5109307.1 hypothetical protein [Streptomyces spectabilis]GGV52349.1 hypothetical protein GCM10010245_82360 [Streptomyces spectabilis]
MLRRLNLWPRSAGIRIPLRRYAAGIAALPPTARDALGTDITVEEATAYNRGRTATAMGIALYRSGYALPMGDDDLDDAVRALDFPYSVPNRETRAAIRAALAVLESDPTIRVTD